MKHQKPYQNLSLSTNSAYCYMQYQGNYPYYSEFPKLRFIKKDDWRFSSDLYHRHCNLNSPLNKCYITSNPNPKFMTKADYPSNEKLDYYYNRGYKKILNQELEKNYERYGYESNRDFKDNFEEIQMETQRNIAQKRREEENRYREELWMMETERKHMVKSLVQQNRSERKLKAISDGSWFGGESVCSTARSSRSSRFY